MNRRAFKAALKQMIGQDASLLDAVMGSPNMPVERRVSAALVALTRLESASGLLPLELVFDIVDPGWRHQTGDPTNTLLGCTIASLAKMPRSMLRDSGDLTHGEAVTLKLVALADNLDGGGIPDDSLNFTLRHSTGKDAYWWIEWIRENAPAVQLTEDIQ